MSFEVRKLIGLDFKMKIELDFDAQIWISMIVMTGLLFKLDKLNWLHEHSFV